MDENPEIVVASPPLDPPWGFRDLVQVILFSILSMLLCEAAGLLFLWRWQGGGRLAKPAADLFSDVRFVLPVQLAAYLLIVAFIYFLIRGKYKKDFWEALHWRSVGPRGPLFLLAGVTLAIAALFVPLVFPADRPMPIEKLFNSPLAGYLLAMFGICVAPFVEELLFRGVLYPVLERRWGLETAVLSTAALFASIHIQQLNWAWPQVAAIFLVGVALSYARGRSGSLVPSYLMHLSYNSTLFVAIFVSSGGFRHFR